ncbi:MAG TPA: hypothetical protein VF719_07210 [Abditibacteriaceae bacterium]|jgi:hypothetical protein
MPRLSVDLPFEKHPEKCQGCGVVERPEDARRIRPEVLLTRWREHDEDDVPEYVIVVLCQKCSDKLVEKHPRLYDDLAQNLACAGCMAVCVDCRHRSGTNCTHPGAKCNGGAGLYLLQKPPSIMFVDGRFGKKGGRRGGFRMEVYSEPVKSCSGREEKE